MIRCKYYSLCIPKRVTKQCQYGGIWAGKICEKFLEFDKIPKEEFSFVGKWRDVK